MFVTAGDYLLISLIGAGIPFIVTGILISWCFLIINKD